MKALSKKRKNQTGQTLLAYFTKTSILRFQTLWYAGFIAVYIWFLYWVAYDFFVWHKPITEVNAANYVGSIVSIALIWAGTKIWKPNRTEARKTPKSQLQQPPPQQKTPQKSMPQIQQQKTSQQTATTNSTCPHYFGYLHQRQKQQEIPAECLTCKKVIECFSSTK